MDMGTHIERCRKKQLIEASFILPAGSLADIFEYLLGGHFAGML
jgi:hypothetical protein